MIVNPLGDRILVKEVSGEQTTASGIFLPDTTEKKKSGIYEVAALGDGQAAKMFKIGQKVVAGKYSGEEIEMKEDKDTEYKILFVGSEKNESDILALIE
jgi:chaperonin GroES